MRRIPLAVALRCCESAAIGVRWRADRRCRYVDACVDAAIGVRFGVVRLRRRLVGWRKKVGKKFLHLHMGCVYND